jgi:tRNA A-37 threonylcarbamoyl transferase component Bud32
MDPTKICQECRQPLPADAPEGLCPACLARAALGTGTSAHSATVDINPPAQAAPGARVPPTPSQLATQFPQLEIIELIGMGGMGMVYKARQPKLDRVVALKILPVESQHHPSFAERFSREAKALAKLNHPGIVALYEFGQTADYYYFIMEYVDGMNLRRLLQTEKVEPRQALELVAQICAALQFAHDEAVVHRDIKPENILITKKGRVKIADFGLAKLLGDAPDTALTMSQAGMGTLNYMAPEQRANAQGVDHRADIYSLGVVFYEMLTGEVPMGRFEAPSKRVQVDVRLDEVVLRALEREPARRYQQASEVKSGVEAVASAAGTPASPNPVPTAPSSIVPRFFWLRNYGLLCAGWLATKYMWNLRGPGLWFATFGMAALVIRISLKRMRLFPDQFAVYAKSSIPTKLVAFAVTLAGLAWAIVVLITAAFSFWEQETLHSNLRAVSVDQYEVRHKGKEYQLLRVLPAFEKDIPSVEMINTSAWDDPAWVVGWGPRRPGRQNFEVIPNLVVGAISLMLFPFIIVGSWRGRGMKALPLPRSHIRASLGVSAATLGSALLVYVATDYAYRYELTEGRPYYCQAGIETVTAAIEQWAGRNGYAMSHDYKWDIDTVPKGTRVAQARMREAWKPSPFDRWKSTLTSFRGVSPHLAFEMVGCEDPAETSVTVTGVLAERIPQDLGSVLDGLRSRRGATRGETNAATTH